MFGSQNCVFLKCTFSGPQLSRRGLVWYLPNSWKASASRGLDNRYMFTKWPLWLYDYSETIGILYQQQICVIGLCNCCIVAVKEPKPPKALIFRFCVSLQRYDHIELKMNSFLYFTLQRTPLDKSALGLLWSNQLCS